MYHAVKKKVKHKNSSSEINNGFNGAFALLKMDAYARRIYIHYTRFLT
jgi:hypothetical protein